MEGARKNNKKVIWWTLTAFVAVILSYMFVVMYFSLINPYDISLRITLWPLYSQSALANIYKEATAEISFKVDGNQEVKLVGVNVRKDGYFLAPFSQLAKYDGQDLKLSTTSGVYGGKLLHAEPAFNLAVIKCEALNESADIKLPFVKIASSVAAQDVVGINSALEVYFGKTVVQEPFCAYQLSESSNYVLNVYENCQTLNIDSKFNSGIVLNKNGQFVGFGYCNTLSLQKTAFEGNIVVSAADAYTFLNDVASAYQNKAEYDHVLESAFDCMDGQELACHLAVSASDLGIENKYFYNGKLEEYSAELLKFNQLQTESGVFLLKDFAFGNVTLPKNSLVVNIRVAGNKYIPKNKHDFMNLIYQISKGQLVEIEYTNIYEANLKSIAFTA